MKLLLFVLAIFVHFIASSQNFIEWDKNTKVKWSDFEGRVDVSSPYAAMSAIGIHYKYNSFSNGIVYKLTFDISSRFDRSKSWSRKYLESSYTLKHEQLHFDIAELITRKFKIEAESTVYSKDYKNETVRLFDKYMQYLQKLQQKYDEETGHSKNKMKQKEWEKFIHKELDM